MTVAEAAAFGAPSVIAAGGQVGVADLLRPAQGEVLEVGMQAGDDGAGSGRGDAAAAAAAAAGSGDGEDAVAAQMLAEGVAAVLHDAARLRRVAAAGRARSLGWGVGEFRVTLLRLLRQYAAGDALAGSACDASAAPAPAPPVV